jgi:hypothetical protein
MLHKAIISYIVNWILACFHSPETEQTNARTSIHSTLLILYKTPFRLFLKVTLLPFQLQPNTFSTRDMPRFSDIKRAILRYYIKNLVADASRLDMGHIIERIAFFFIALGLNCIFPSPVAFFSVTVLAILVWKCLYLRYVQDMTYYYGKAIMESRNNHMVRDSAYVDLALYFCYLIATIVGEWIQKKKLTSEICQLKQENGELVRRRSSLYKTRNTFSTSRRILVQHSSQSFDFTP